MRKANQMNSMKHGVVQRTMQHLIQIAREGEPLFLLLSSQRPLSLFQKPITRLGTAKARDTEPVPSASPGHAFWPNPRAFRLGRAVNRRKATRRPRISRETSTRSAPFSVLRAPRAVFVLGVGAGAGGEQPLGRLGVAANGRVVERRVTSRRAKDERRNTRPLDGRVGARTLRTGLLASLFFWSIRSYYL